ncbi:MAG: Rieske (2Fe-2S) protein [Planctomycetota bacterium]
MSLPPESPASSALSRRQFLARTAAGAAVCAGLAGCRVLNPDARLYTGTLEGGRVALGAADDLAVGGQLKVTVEGAGNVVLVVRATESDYHAVQMYCTHFGSELALVGDGSKLRCTNHGAEFDFSGQVLKGPASNPLKAYAVTNEAGKLYLTIPG